MCSVIKNNTSSLTVAVVGVPLSMIFVGSTQVMVNKGMQLTLSLLLCRGYHTAVFISARISSPSIINGPGVAKGS